MDILIVKNKKVVFFTIVYDKLWKTMRDRGVSQYKLIKCYKICNVHNGPLDRLRKNEAVSTYTLNRLCEILHCGLDDIAEYKDEETGE